MALSTEDEKPSRRSSQDKNETPEIVPSQDQSLESIPNEQEKTPSSISKAWNTVRNSKIYALLSWTPPRCRWNPESPPKFSMALNCLFAFAGAFTVANLYYSHPILNILAHDFGVSYEQVSQVPTLAQAGYAVGLALLCPLGDVFKRRPFTLLLVLFTATVW
jgi:hypothetical protein